MVHGPLFWINQNIYISFPLIKSIAGKRQLYIRQITAVSADYIFGWVRNEKFWFSTFLVLDLHNNKTSCQNDDTVSLATEQRPSDQLSHLAGLSHLQGNQSSAHRVKSPVCFILHWTKSLIYWYFYWLRLLYINIKWLPLPF